MATTAKDRAKLEREIFLARQQQARAALRAELDRDKDLSPAQRNARMAGFDNAAAGETASFDRRAYLAANPWAQYVQDVNFDSMEKQFQDIAVNGVETLTDSITEAIMEAKNLGDAFKQVANQIIADLIRIAVRKFIVGTLSNIILPGSGTLAGARAMGGPVSSGQSYLVGERGPEIFTPNKSGAIIPNHKIGGGVGGVVVQQNIMVDARDAVLGSTLRQEIGVAARISAQQGANMGRTMTQQDMAKAQRKRLR